MQSQEMSGKPGDLLIFPQNDRYGYGQGIEPEVYPSDETDDPDYTCEIWIAVNEK